MSHPAAGTLFVIPSLGTGGAERVVVSLATGLAQQGHPVGVATFLPGGDYLDLLPPQVQVYCRGHRVKTLPELVGGACWLAGVSQPYATVVSALHLATEEVVLGCRLLQRAGGQRKRYLAMVQGALSGIARFASSRAKQRRFAGLYRHFDGIVTVSHGVKGEVERLFQPPSPIEVIYNPLDLECIRQQAAEPLPAPCPTPYFLSVGRWSMEKDLPTLLRAFAAFTREDRTGHHLVLLGRGPLEADLRALAAELQLANVHFLDFDPNPWRYMRGASALLSSSIMEGFSLVIVEALACGTPVISTDCPYGPAEVLQGGAFGTLVPMQDPAALAAAMHQLLADPAAARTRVAQAESFVAQLALPAVTARYIPWLQGTGTGG